MSSGIDPIPLRLRTGSRNLSALSNRATINASMGDKACAEASREVSR